MTAEEVWQAEREAFFAERRTYIGGSDAAAILGLSRWRTRVDVWVEKVGLVTPSTEMGMRQFIGLRLEPLIAEMAAVRLGRSFRRYRRLVRSKTYPMIGGHVDFVGLEVKTSYSAEGWGPDGTPVLAADRDSWDAVPIDYLLQVQHYLYITGWPSMIIAVLIGHDDLRTYPVEPIPALIEPMVAEEIAFWTDHVVTGAAPELDASEGAKAYLRAKFPRATGGLRTATPEETILIEKVRETGAAAKAADKAHEAAKNVLKARIGADLGLSAPGVTVTYPSIEKAPEVQWQAIAQAYRSLITDPAVDLDAIVSLHTGQPSSYRRINVAYSRRD